MEMEVEKKMPKKGTSANMRITAELMFRLLPVQILLSLVSAVNGIVSSYFASNDIGVDAMSAVGLYSPFNQLFFALITMVVGGSVILCGKYMGQNREEEIRNVFSLSILVSVIFAVIFILIFLYMAIFDRVGMLTQDPAVRPLFRRYLIGQALAIFPLLVGNQLSSFLALEHKEKKTMTASLAYIAVNVILNILLVRVMKIGILGLALASAIGLWVFFLVQAVEFVPGRSMFRLALTGLRWGECGRIVRIGFSGAASNLYQTIRGFILNHLLSTVIGSVALSAFATSDNVLRIFWSIPFGMIVVSRMMIGISVGEEDRQTLADIMRVMLYRFVPLMCVVCCGIALLAVPITHLFYHDPASDVFRMTVLGLRIIPICMPLSIIYMHFVCYGQASDKQWYVHILSLLDGVICVAGFSALLIRPMGISGVYLSSVLNGIVTMIVIVGYAWWKKRGVPKNMEELMVIPEDFGAPEDARIDVTVKNMDEVVSVSRQIGEFCKERGIDSRRAYLAGLAMEEMAGNIVEHGFTKDKKKHAVDVRVVDQGEDLILRIRDDCVPFDPAERRALTGDDDKTKNIGLRMIFGMAKDLWYQSILGLNVMTIKV